jgi:hypothetical protein
MANLAETLRQVGYVTPQGQVTGPNAPLAQQLKNYVTNVIPTAAQNLAQQRADIDAAITMGNQGIQIGDREAFERQMAQVPNLMGSTNAFKTLPDDYNKLSTMATEAYDALRKNPSKETSDYYKMVMKARDEAPLNNPRNVQNIAPQTTSETYQGQHQAPTAGSGKPLFDLTDIYPEDFYSAKGVQYYGVGNPNDARVISQLQGLRNRPNDAVWMYRAVPKDAPSAINKGDWVTIDRQYAKEHGESALNNEYKIIKRKVYARDLFTNGDSPYEMGYDPQPKVSRRNVLEKVVK